MPTRLTSREVQKIKKDLIHKAKVRKTYAKVKQRELGLPQENPAPVSDDAPRQATPNLERHPERQLMLDEADRPPVTSAVQAALPDDRSRARKRRSKPAPYRKEMQLAEQRKAEAEQKRQQREMARQQRQQKMEERERFRRAMAKARTGGKNGQRKLGRESKVLLERVKKVMGETT